MIAHVLLHTRSKNIQHDLESTMERVFNLLTILFLGIVSIIFNLGSSYMGPVGVDRTFTLNMFGDNQYKFFPSNYVVSGVIGSTDSSCAGKNSSPGTGPWLPGLGTMVLTLPATGSASRARYPVAERCARWPTTAARRRARSR